MAEEQGIEAAWERFMHPEGGLAPPYRQARDAARALALVLLDRAQTTWRSDPEEYMQQQDTLRARIEALD